ncbi:NHLP bacteriocin export ABC transporter permease/ATPase subunit [Methylobacterium sp. CM6247]
MPHEAPHWIAASGTTVVDHTGGVPIASAGLRVDIGSADLYLDWAGRAGRRRHLATLGLHEIALPLSLTATALSMPAEARLLAFPRPGSRLSSFAVEPFLARLDAGEAAAIEAAENWVDRTARAAGEVLTGTSVLLGEGKGTLESGCVARPAQGLLWVAAGDAAILTNLPGAGPSLPGMPAVPVTSGGIVADRSTVIDCRTSADLAVEGGLADALLGHHERVTRALAFSEANREADEVTRIAGKAARDRAVLAATVAPLLAPAAGGSPHDDSLASAFRTVAEATAVSMPSTQPPDASKYDGLSIEGQIADLAAWAGVRTRRIRLEPGWWRRGGQSILSVRREDGRPVALIAGTGWRGGYRIREVGRDRPVDARTAAAIVDHGYVLQRRLPDAAIDGGGLLRFAAPLAWPTLTAILIIGLVGSLLGLVTPIATEILFETVIPAASHPELLQLTAGIAALGLGGIVFELVRGFLVLRLATLLNTDLEGAVWDRLLHLPAGFFRNYAAGDLALRAAAINQMHDVVGGTAVSSLLSAVFSVSSLALILYYEWRLALVAIGLVLLQLVVTVGVNLRMLSWKQRALEKDGQLQALALQLIQGIAKLKVAGAEARAFARWSPLFIARRALGFRQSGLSSAFSAFATAFGIASAALLIGIVGLGGIEIGIGRFVAFNAAYGQFMSATLSLGSALPALLSLKPLYGRAAPLLAALPENIGRHGALPTLRGGIEVSDVVFRYRADGPVVLDGVSIRVNPGEFVGIVGTSGSGKSTLMRILLGFETPESGSVFFDDQALSSLDLLGVRRQMGVVLQSSRATSGTILDNILNGATLTEADAWEAARIAGLEADIRAMPMRMHTFVGEDGTLLSGGQRQRLLIARAVVRRPRILLFDEATSALDNRTQQIVSEGLAWLDATRVVIAHRLSTIQHADRIYVLQGGRIAEEGSYRELLEKGGVLAELALRQVA